MIKAHQNIRPKKVYTRVATTLPRASSSTQASTATSKHVSPRMIKQVRKESLVIRTLRRLGLLADDGYPKTKRTPTKALLATDKDDMSLISTIPTNLPKNHGSEIDPNRRGHSLYKYKFGSPDVRHSGHSWDILVL
ncbi:UNVERIFIED_CONTAM: hypothetical protein Sradi_3957100 [Sesamum radiatum]|uniref:Uncharacterized protein n=1 Tax=Sesamum radiatum TaxID=300843 RepID=A0AAW2PGU0_SESRA